MGGGEVGGAALEGGDEAGELDGVALFEQVRGEARGPSVDARGPHAFFPQVNGVVFRTLQIPTTLPTFDELLGRPEYPETQLVERYLSWLQPGRLNVLTVHAEIEGMSKIEFFHALLRQAQQRSVRFVRMNELAREYLNNRNAVPVCELVHDEVDGRSGTLAVQKAA